MAIISSGSFVATSNKTAGTSFLFTSSLNIPQGGLAVLFVGVDNLTTSLASNNVLSVRDNAIAYNFNQGTGFNATARTITSQSDGKILVGGDFSSYNGSDAPNIIRLNTDGTIDSSFIDNLDGSVKGNVYKIINQSSITGSTYSGSGVWSNGGALITARDGPAGGGLQNSGLASGGSVAGTIVTCTEEYNGTSWAAGGAITTARYQGAGMGTQNSGLIAGGLNTSLVVVSNTEEYNGTSWSAGGALTTARAGVGGAGTQNAGLAFGGSSNVARVACTEEYNGTSWSAGGALITIRSNMGGAGTQNAGLAFGGTDININAVSCTEEYDGTTWSTGGALITARDIIAGTGTQNVGLATGNSSLRCTEEYNGTSWAAGGAMILQKSFSGAAGTQKSALVFGGSSTPTSEEYNVTNTTSCISDKILAVGDFGVVRLNDDGTTDATFQNNVGTNTNNIVCTAVVEDFPSGYTSGFWTAGGALINARYSLGGAGTQNEGLAFGGIGNVVRVTEEYDGTTWTAGGTMINDVSDLAGAGTQNAGLAFGGFILACTEEYDGTTWTAGGNLITARYGLAGMGTQNLALAAGGSDGFTVLSCTEEYNGTSWSAGGTLTVARERLAGAGTQNEGLIFGGYGNTGDIACAEEYNGATWTAGGNLITPRRFLGGAGTQNAGLAFGGCPTSCACTEEYNGTSWTSQGALITGRCCLAGTGLQSSGLAFGGCSTTAFVSCTEEYSQGTFNSKIILGGIFTQFAGSTYSGSVKLLENGAIDTSFNIGTGFSGSADVKDLKLYTSGSTSCLLAVGNFTGYSGSLRNRIAFIDLTNGTVIPTSSFNIGAGFNNTVNSIDIAPNNKLVAVGNFTSYSGSGVSRIARINTNGLIDSGSSFNSGTGGLNSTGSIVKIYTSASIEVILVGGTFTQYSGSTSSGSVRILTSGSRDTNFVVGAGFGSTVDVQDFLIDTANNDIYTVGSFTTYSGSFSPQPNRIVRVNPNGTIDASSTGNTWIKLLERGTGDAAAAGSAVAMFYLSPTSSIVYAGTSITASLSGSITAKAATGWVFNTTTSLSPITGVVSSSAAGGTSDPPAMRLTGSLTGSGEYLFIRGISYENTALTFTPTANFITMSAAGTVGGTTTTNQTVLSEFRIVSTSSLVSDPSISAATSNANIFYVFYENDAVVSGSKTYFILID